MKTVALSPDHWESSASLFRKSTMAPHPRLRERLVALALIAEGLPAKVVAQRLGRNRGTVESWVQRFNADGLDGLERFSYQCRTLPLWATTTVVLTDWLSIIAALGFGSRPAWLRTAPYSAAWSFSQSPCTRQILK
jgi:hypothetical protein